ncbi:SDR family oxidoreductase [Enemella sp. A6]|uniref:SDR family oxidoreductase n=1 Tax=Enemella sp. A6 TaxID=3440152 RepID=UPI003EC0BA66
MDLKLAGKAVIITGASSGVGLATARMLVAEGAHVVGCARDANRLADVAEELHGPGSFTGVAGDVLVAEDMQNLVARTLERHGRLDGLVCNAGRSLMAPLDETTDEQIREEFDLKVFGVLHLVRAAEQHLAASDAGSVVVINAILARQPEHRLPVTSAARAALLNLTKTLSNELGTAGTRVNSVSLGLVDTGQWRRRYEASGSELDYDQWSAETVADRGIVLGRFGRAEEVAFPIVTLLSPLSGYCTGATIDVGGGVSRYI